MKTNVAQDNTAARRHPHAVSDLAAALAHRVHAGRFAGQTFGAILASGDHWGWLDWLARNHVGADGDAARLIAELARWSDLDHCMFKVWATRFAA